MKEDAPGPYSGCAQFIDDHGEIVVKLTDVVTRQLVTAVYLNGVATMEVA